MLSNQPGIFAEQYRRMNIARPSTTGTPMSQTAIPLPRGASSVLADVIPTVRERTMLLVMAGALLTAAASQVKIPLGFTPVPVNLATFSAVLVGGALGARRGAASMGLFLICGIVGFPFFTGANSGWAYFTGATGGYLLAYPLMAVIVGVAAQHGRDRHVPAFIVAVVMANMAVYVVGAAWLAHVINVPLIGSDTSAWSLGIRPFLAGDAVKMIAAGLAFPAAWRFVER
ncbi:MAG: biotin transport system substrate-specific component [Ilumatobacter sp.]|jgi:biotin transport system substrate-specific component